MAIARNVRLLVIDDELHFYHEFQQRFRSTYAFEVTSDSRRGLTLIKEGSFDAVLLDLSFDQYGSYEEGLEFILPMALGYAQGRFPIIIATSDNRDDTARIALEKGAAAFMRKATYTPDSWDQKIRSIVDTFNKPKLTNATPPTYNLAKVSDIVFVSQAMKDIEIRLRKIAAYPTYSVLLLGESGVGKEVAAKYIHQSKADKSLPFRAVNLSAISSELFESELFGHTKGAFTGANSDRIGHFEAAGNGTLFLDEVGDLSHEIQVKLLRVIQERQFEKVGSIKAIPLKAQLVFATNVDLQLAVDQGDFRRDFYERIRGGLEIVIPPLRNRPEDLHPLANLFLIRHCENPNNPLYGKTFEACFSSTAIDRMRQYNWPGNIRELDSVIKTLVFEADVNGFTTIEEDVLPQRFWRPAAILPIPPPSLDEESEATVRITKEEILCWLPAKQDAYSELEKIQKALIQSGGRKDDAAKILGFKNEQFLRYRIKEKYFKKYTELFNFFPTICKVYKLK